MRIAVDVNVSNVEIGKLSREGDMVVCVAMDKEEDSSWLSRAIENRADVVISRDLDIPNLLDRWNVLNVLWFENLWSYRDWKDKRSKPL